VTYLLLFEPTADDRPQTAGYCVYSGPSSAVRRRSWRNVCIRQLGL